MSGKNRCAGSGADCLGHGQVFCRPSGTGRLAAGDRNASPSWLAVSHSGRLRFALLAIMALLSSWLLSGCATPYGVAPAGLRGAYEEVNVSALTSPVASSYTRTVLYRHNLLEQYDEAPETVLAFLHRLAAGGDDRRDLRFALAELNFLYGEKLEQASSGGQRVQAANHYLVSALYAYYYLFGTADEPLPNTYDNHFRQACAFYNRALGKGLESGADGAIIIGNQQRHLPFGSLQISVDATRLARGLAQFESFVLADDYLVRGFTIRNRDSGLGVPLIGIRPQQESALGARIVPLTAFLRITSPEQELTKDTVGRAQLEVYPAYDETEVMVNGQTVPLETDQTAAIAYALDNADIWTLDLRRFFFLKEQIKPQIVMISPYDPGKIPVVFVHGTASEMIWWAEMFNTLRGDATLNRRYHFWFFRYNSDHPLMGSAAALRDILREKYRQLAAADENQALDNMVIIGHSQGGLLTKATAVSSGDRLWRALSDEPFESFELSSEAREMLTNFLFIEPLPFVRRAVFISTPHRGSFLAKLWIGSLFRRLAGLPTAVIRGSKEFLTMERKLKLPIQLKGRLPTSIDGMSPKNPVLLELAELPVSPAVKTHSIIAVKDLENYRESDDGVVEYQSAHLPGVESEFLVESTHSCQQHPLVIEEVRRILLQHLTEIDGP
ncbi:alpha/beta hydrolase [bacterium]|nr:alpha/beta hydrolase [bacterium]